MHTPRFMDRMGRPDRVEVAHTAKRLYDAMRTATRHAPEKEYCEVAQDYRRDILSKPNMHPVEHILTILNNAMRRNTPQADAEAFWLAGLAWTRQQYALKRGMKPLPLPVAHLNEEMAEGTREVAEVAFRNDPSPYTAHKLMDAIRGHEIATDSLEEVAESYLNNLQRVS